MNKDARRRQIAALIADSPDASSRSIAKAIGCSQATVVRDLSYLRGDSVIHLVNQSEPADVSPQPSQPTRGDARRSAEAVRVLAELDAELDANSKRTDRNMGWTAVDRQMLSLIADHVDRQVELQAMYEACEQTRTKLAIATELRLVQSAIARLLKQIDADPAEPAPMSVRSRKAQKAANSRWNPGCRPGVTGAG